jgi:prophage maintenance system killer protein/prophage antirepressor-like protein
MSKKKQLTEAQEYYIGLFERWQKMSKDPQVKIDNPELWGWLQKTKFTKAKTFYSSKYYESEGFVYGYKSCDIFESLINLFYHESPENIILDLKEGYFEDSKTVYIDYKEKIIDNCSFNIETAFNLYYLKSVNKINDKNFLYSDELERVLDVAMLEEKYGMIDELKLELNNLTSPVITNEKGEVIIYQNPNGSIEVNLKNGDIWLTQAKIAQIFGVDRSVATKHINKIFRDEEIDKTSNVQKMHFPNSDKPVNLYSLDVILAVGYKTSTAKAIKFRQWANTILKEYITKGYSINQNRFEEIKDELKFLIQNKPLLSNDTFEFLFDKYTQSLVTLNQYDENKIPEIPDEHNIDIGLEESWLIINKTKLELTKQGEAWDGFGKELDKKFSSTIGALNQTYGSQPVYNRSQKLANLLYLIVKNHSFVDGNKRIGAILFVYFCSRANVIIDPNNLVSLTLLIAQSNPNDKDNLIKLIQIIIN